MSSQQPKANMPIYSQYQAYKDEPTEKRDQHTKMIARKGDGFLTPTGKDIPGPFYKGGAPFLEVVGGYPAMIGYPTLFLSGEVLDVHGSPIRNAVLDFWQADADGNYDLEGFHLRGKVRADLTIKHYGGGYKLATIIPGCYDITEPGKPQEFRCAHIHVKLSADGYVDLTTQLYFADSPFDDVDHWFSPDRVIEFSSASNGTFDFVLKLAE